MLFNYVISKSFPDKFSRSTCNNKIWRYRFGNARTRNNYTASYYCNTFKNRDINAFVADGQAGGWLKLLHPFLKVVRILVASAGHTSVEIIFRHELMLFKVFVRLSGVI